MALTYGVSNAQEPNYTPMSSFYRFKGIRMDSLFILPAFTDTTSANTGGRIKNITGSLINASGTLYERRNNKWNAVSGAIPALYQVLNYNHDLIQDNNFQGTDAGFGVTDTSNIGFGRSALYNSIGDNKIAIGREAGRSSKKNEQISIGRAAGYFSNGDNGIYIGEYSGYLDSGINTIQIGSNATNANKYDYVILLGTSAIANGDSQIVFNNSGNPSANLRLKNNVTTNRTINFPDKSGTFALLSDVDTTSLSNRINLKLDSLRRSNDSVYAWRNGSKVFQFKDSLKPDNPSRIHGSTNSNVTGLMNGNQFAIGTASLIAMESYISGYRSKLNLNESDASTLSFENDIDTTSYVRVDKAGVDLRAEDLSNAIYTNIKLYPDLIQSEGLKYSMTNDTLYIGSPIIKGNFAADKAFGTATLSGGTVTVNNTTVTADSKIMLTLQECISCGVIYIDGITAGTSFAITSTDVSDNSEVFYMIINP